MTAAQYSNPDGVERLCFRLGSDAAPGTPLRALLLRLDWVAPLPNSAAPGFVYLAGALLGEAVGGGGATLLEASWKLAGEAAETIAKHSVQPSSGLPGLPAVDRTWQRNMSGPRLAARRLPDEVPISVPACAVAASADIADFLDPSAPQRSLGMAAGVTVDEARCAGLLELVERDAVARWWLHQQPPHSVDLRHAAPVADLVAALRNGADAPQRATGLLLLGSPTGVPVVCAFSLEPDGRGLAVGFRAAFDVESAARGAVLEMMQMEIALFLARHRSARGGRTEGDSAALERAALRVSDLPEFRPQPAIAASVTVRSLNDLLDSLAAQEMTILAADLAVSVDGIAVSKVFCDRLIPFPAGNDSSKTRTLGSTVRLL